MIGEQEKKHIRIKTFKNGVVAVFDESSPRAACHLDFSKNAFLSLILREEGAVWVLGFVESGRTFTPIASFNHRDDAEDAWDALQRAMAACRKGRHHGAFHWVGMGLSFLVAAYFAMQILAFVLGAFSSHSATPMVAFPAQEKTAPVSAAPSGELEYGQPLSADDVLKQQLGGKPASNR